MIILFDYLINHMINIIVMVLIRTISIFLIEYDK